MEKSERFEIRVLDDDICFVTVLSKALRTALAEFLARVERSLVGVPGPARSWDLFKKGRSECLS